MRHSDRVAAAAKAALDGFRGLSNSDSPGAAPVPRSPGIQVLFAPASDGRIDGWAGAAQGVDEDLEPVDVRHVDDAGQGSATSPVWNPFRQACDPPRVVPGDARIVHVHTRSSPAEATVIATVEHHGRRGHGTAIGPPSSEGMLHAVAEATLAALRMVVAGPFPAKVEQVTRSSVEDPATVSVAILWFAPEGDRRLVGQRATDQDPARAVMQATLDAVRHRLTASGTARGS